VQSLHHALAPADLLLEQRQHEVVTDVPGRGLMLDADPVRLSQVLANLLNNAAKYTPEGGHIWLTAEKRDGESVIRVRDTGMGIPPEILPKVFDLFTQAERTLDRAEGGLGIGLTLVRSLVELHGGSVEARSDSAGQGSAFEVLLPLKPAGPA